MKTMNVNEQLSTAQQAMIPIAALTASGDLDRLKLTLNGRQGWQAEV